MTGDALATAEAVVAACRILTGERLTEAFGHVSARIGDGRILISPAGPGLVSGTDDLLEVQLDHAGAASPAVPGEVHIHLSVYRARPDVSGVCRFHPPGGMAFSTLGAELLPTTSYGAFVGPRVPVHATSGLARSPAAGDAVAATLGAGAAVLLRGFGAVTVGACVEEATVRAVFLEREAVTSLAARGAGGGAPLEKDVVEPFSGDGELGHLQMQRAWAYYCRRHVSTPQSGNDTRGR
jgi:HCOMODA/2-hydroxy-3-carboxy-muconic semialdehyde decarboxylase